MTLMEDSRSGVAPLIEEVARREGLDPEWVRRGVAAGRIVIPHNPVHAPEPCGIGEGLSVKVNVNLGSSRDIDSLDEELEKLRVALRHGAHAVMDLSTGGDVDGFRRAVIKESPVMVGTVPIYQTGLSAARRGAVVDMDEDDIFNGIEAHARDGVDFMTVHCGITKESVEWLKRSDRLTGVVSRGGSFLTAWILHNEEENPLYGQFDYLLEMAREHEFTLSLGDGFRPGSIADSTDPAQVSELMILGELVKRSRAAGVQCMVEGPGHVPLHMVESNVRMQKSLCHDAPFYVLGPLVTDIAPGYDHIVGAIGGALAAQAGADFLCYLTPAEHLCLPTVDDVREGVVASMIAAHVGDIAHGRGGDRDQLMSRARADLDWETMYSLAVDGEKARRYRARGATKEDEGCSMCGDVCAIRILKDYLKN